MKKMKTLLFGGNGDSYVLLAYTNDDIYLLQLSSEILISFGLLLV